MFSSLGLFGNVPCPRQHECGLPHCIFSHYPPILSPVADDTLQSAKEYDPCSAGEVRSPPPKRRRLASPHREDEVQDTVKTIPANSKSNVPLTVERQPSTGSKAIKSANVEAGSTGVSTSKAQEDFKTTPASVARPVSPPPTRERKLPGPNSKKAAAKVESLTPRNVSKAPAMLKTRLAVLQKLHEQMHVQNQKLLSEGEKLKVLALDEQELITFALDDEEAATKLGDDIYKNAMAQNILRVKKMTTKEWLHKVAEWTGTSSMKEVPARPVNDPLESLSTLLSARDQQVAVLKHLRTPLEGLERFGYVTKKPTANEIASAKAGLTASAGFESCDRCGTRFQVFPGRDENGRLASHGQCRYHWARANRTVRQKTDNIKGQSEATYPCCNKLEGSEGCAEAETHVFDAKDPKRLATILQFEHTPEKSDVRRKQPVSFDCEMGYTTLGMEVIRVTAVSWPEGRLLLDFLVRPYGEILDLNTRFSGVTKDGYASALPYDATLSEPREHSSGPFQLRKVGSVAAARQLLFDCLSPETPLIGHAIENDLNVCRIIHPFVIDTALLYPHPRGLPIKYGLKMLSQKYLSRGIQTGGEAGHDSKEDAVATGDLVTKKVAEKWKAMRHEGWQFVDGILMAPEEAKKGAWGQAML